MTPSQSSFDAVKIALTLVKIIPTLVKIAQTLSKLLQSCRLEMILSGSQGFGS